MIGIKAEGSKPEPDKKEWIYEIGTPYGEHSKTRHLSARENTAPLPKPLSRLETAWLARYGEIPVIEEFEEDE